MRREKRRLPGSHVVVTLTLEREAVQAIDAVSRVLGMDRQAVLEHGFIFLVSSMVEHEGCAGGLGVGSDAVRIAA